MMRRAILFLLILSGGIAILSLAIGGEDMFDPAAADVRRSDVRPVPSETINIDVDSRTSNASRVSLVLRDKIVIYGPRKSISAPDGKKRSYPSYVLRASNPEQLADGTCKLTALTIDFPQMLRLGDRIEKRNVVQVTARSGTIALAIDEDHTLQIDREHEIEIAQVNLVSRVDGLVSGSRSRGSHLRLWTEQLTAKLQEDRVDLRTKDPSEPVWIALDAGTTPVVIAGKGFDASMLENGSRAPDSTSMLRLKRDVSIWSLRPGADLELVRADPPEGFDPRRHAYRLTGDGPLELVIDAKSRGRLELLGHIRFRGELGGSGEPGARGRRVEATGTRVLAWIRRGVMPGVDRSRLYLSPSLTEVLLLGAPELPCVVHMGTQEVVAEEIQVEMDPFGDPGAVEARGKPLLRLSDRRGQHLARVIGGREISWARDGVLASRLLAGTGIDLDGMGRELALPLWPEEEIRVSGPSEILPARASSLLERGYSEGGFVVYLNTRFGQVEPFLALGFGRVKLEGRVSRSDGARSDGAPDPDDGRFSAEGNRGFAITRLPGTGFLRGILGPSEPSRKHRFSVRTETEVLGGRGLLSFEGEAASVEGPPARLALRFTAALGEELSWRRSTQKLDVSGIKSAHLARGPVDSLRLWGLPLEFEREGIRGSCEVLEQSGAGPWILEGGIRQATLSIAAEGSRAPVSVAADRVRLVPDESQRGFGSYRPGAGTGAGTRGDAWTERLVWIDARGRVRLSSRDGTRKLDLECERLRYLPWLVAPVVETVQEAMLGPAARILNPVLFEGQRGVFRAEAQVRVHVQERGSGNGVLDGRFEAHRVDLGADGLSLRMLPEQGKLVLGTMRQAGGGRVEVRAEDCRYRGGRLFIGESREGRTPVVYLSEAMNRLRVSSAGPITFVDGWLCFPGPVKADQITSGRRGSERIVRDGFFLRSRDRLLLEIDASKLSPASMTPGNEARRLPSFLETFRALGDVSLGFKKAVAEGAELSLDARSGWLELKNESASPAVLRYGQRLRWEHHPGFSYNLWTGEMHGGRGRLVMRLRSGARE